MPLLMNDFQLTPEEEVGHQRLMNYLYPEYSHQSWADKLKSNGLSLDSLASIYAEALFNVSPAMKLKAIERMLTLIGVDARIETAKEIAKNQTPQINIQLNTGSSTNLLQMVAPVRTIKPLELDDSENDDLE